MSTPPYVRLPDGVRAGELSTGRGPLAALCADENADAPTVLLVPGYTGSKEDFIAVLAPLAGAGYRAVAIDLRGQLDSRGLDDPRAYAVGALAADVLEVTQVMRPPVHLVGHSLGGLVCRAAAIAESRAVRSLTLLCSGPAAIPGLAAERLRALAPVLAAGGVPAVWAASRALDATDPAYVVPPVEVAAFLERRFLASHPVGLAAMANALLTEPDRVTELKATGVPLLVAHGAGDDAWSPLEQQEMARRLGARYVVIPRTAHSPAAEDPTATVEVMLDFLRSVDA